MKLKWFAVKTIYVNVVSGKPKYIDSHYDKDLTLAEERVVLIKAVNSKDAIRKAEKEVLQYVGKEAYHNPYGQEVRIRYLGACEVFELFEGPSQNVEVFSSTRLLKESLAKKQIKNLFLGVIENKTMKQKRKKFLNVGLR